MKFCITVPTAQPQEMTKDILAKLKASFTYPTTFHILDGSIGKSQALNLFLQTQLPNIECDLYATIDDNIVLPENWQHYIARAFACVPKLGATSPDYSYTQEGRSYMVEVNNIERHHEVDFRPLHKINVAGKCLIMRKSVAMAIGSCPVIGNTHYQYYEDGWRCQQIKNMGLRLGYTVCGEPEIIHYNDTTEYTENKNRDIKVASNILSGNHR